jgi:adenylosuccinate lyase
VAEDPEMRKVLTADELAGVFRLERYLGHVDTVFRRVFQEAEEKPMRKATVKRK